MESPNATYVIEEYEVRLYLALCSNYRTVLVKLSLLTGGVSLFNALILSNLCKYRRKSYYAKTRFFALHFCCRHHVSSFNQFDAVGFKSNAFSVIKQNNGHYDVQGHSRSPIRYQSKAHMRLNFY